MTKKCEHTFLKLLKGTDQSDRLKKGLLPENLLLMDFSVAEWMAFAYNFSKEVNYFGIQNDSVPQGHWDEFFIEKENIQSFLDQFQESGNLTPHLTLFISFLKLLDFSKNRFNKLTKRHLDFYYREILQINKKAPVPDQVHLLFELAKNAEITKIDAGSLLEAGKDPSGKRLLYATAQENVINKAEIKELKSIYHHRKTTNKNPLEHHGIFVAPITNSADGQGAKLEKNDAWFPFGYPNHLKGVVPLPAPKLGFSIAAPTLLLQEGKRKVKFTFTLKNNLEDTSFSDLNAVIEVYATGEKEWIGPIPLTNSTGYESKVVNKSLELSLELDHTVPGVFPYDKKIHLDNYNTRQPLFKFLIKTEVPEFNKGYQLFTGLMNNKIIQVKIDVDVKEAKSPKLKNDLGNIAPDKPFYPFTTQPMERSAFYINYPECFSKNWKTLRVKGKWLNTPADFKEHYIAYRKDNDNKNLSPLMFHQVLYYNYNSATKVYTKPSGSNPIKQVKTNNATLYVPDNNHFKANISITNVGTQQVINPPSNLFNGSNGDYHLNLNITNAAFSIAQNGPLKLSLNQSFLHSIYPKMYALSLKNEEDTLLPNEPYTPLLEGLELSYTADQSVNFNTGIETSQMEAIQVFQEHPFGQRETKQHLVGQYCQGGELYLGLENAMPLQTVHFLFQMDEGSENPLANGYAQGENMEWFALANNQWIPLESQHLLGNETDNFLKTGIVTISLPENISSQNTLFPEGLLWIKVKSPKTFDAVCKIIAIHTQVIKAVLNDQNNDLSHLETGLPSGTISKLIRRDAFVKKIEQPYNSFGGSPKESDTGYYKRVSERLRHKDRAISLWDYEHLVLEHFSEIYKIKCLNHTSQNNFISPGNVTLVVIPDCKNKNAFDPFQPRVNTAILNEIAAYVNRRNSFFVETKVVNPDYEELQVQLKVKFNPGFDVFFHITKLENDLKRMLAPWAYESESNINFGNTVHKSKIIVFIESLNYVDYVEEVILNHRISPTSDFNEVTHAIPSSPTAILVSAKSHLITPITTSCKTQSIKTESICLP